METQRWAESEVGSRAFMRADECSGDPVSTCKVPQQEIVHGGFGLKGQGFVGCTSRSS